MYFNKPGLDDTEVVASGPARDVWAVANAPGPKGGLQRFSAGKWSPYSVPGFDGSTVAVRAILADREGSLWVGTEKSGLYRIHGGVADHYGPADGLSGYEVVDLYEDHEGNLWVTTDGGVDMFRNTPVIAYSDREGLSSSHPSAILASRDGSIWIGGENGVDVLRNGRKRHLPGWAKWMEQATYSLFEDHSGEVWLAPGNDLLYWDHGQFHTLMRHNGNPAGQFVTGITEDTQHDVWALSETYLFRVHHQQVQQRIQLPKNFAPRGLLAPDLQGGVWISDSANHLFRYWNGEFQTTELKDLAAANAIQAMISDADDPLLVATLGGLFRWDGHRWTTLDAATSFPARNSFQ